MRVVFLILLLFVIPKIGETELLEVLSKRLSDITVGNFCILFLTLSALWTAFIVALRPDKS